MPVDIVPLEMKTLDALDRLLGASPISRGCWCIWFIIPVKQFHDNSLDGNRAALVQHIEASHSPLGFLAIDAGEPVGWIAAGPRTRFARAIKTPSFAGRDPAEDQTVWLIPCITVRPDKRGSGIGHHLLGAAIEQAKAEGALAIEAFPYAADKRQTRDTQVGFEPMFAGRGFEVVRRTSSSRLVMRLAL